MSEEKKEPEHIVLDGELKYQITLVNKTDVDIRYEQSNENNLISFHATQVALEELLDNQRNLADSTKKMSSEELKNLQIAIKIVGKYTGSLAAYVLEKYKNAVPTAERKIEIIKPMHYIPKIKG